MFLGLRISPVIILTKCRGNSPYTKVGDSKELVCRLTIINIREHLKLAFKRCVLDNKSGETLANRNFHEL